jgi:predicted  nucleic acid-binding Zn-ribbon protein
MISLDDYQTLLREREELKRKRDKAQGALDQVMKELKELGCPTLKKARIRLKKLKALAEKEGAEAEAELTRFREDVRKAKDEHRAGQD